jgi:hypothetical protein
MQNETPRTDQMLGFLILLGIAANWRLCPERDMEGDRMKTIEDYDQASRMLQELGALNPDWIAITGPGAKENGLT